MPQNRYHAYTIITPKISSSRRVQYKQWEILFENITGVAQFYVWLQETEELGRVQ